MDDTLIKVGLLIAASIGIQLLIRYIKGPDPAVEAIKLDPNMVNIDFIARHDEGSYAIGLVLKGPWRIDLVQDHLEALRERLRRYVNVVLTGQIAGMYPETVGKRMVIKLVTFGTPKEPVEELFEQFKNEAASSHELQQAIRDSAFVSDLAFEYSWQELKKDQEPEVIAYLN